MGSREFFKEFDNPKTNKFPSLQEVNGHQRVTFQLYRQIIIKFLTIYFYDVYFLNRPFYFFLSGNLMLNKAGNTIRENRIVGNKIVPFKKIGQTINLCWYNRPCERFFRCIKIKKLSGSTNRLPLIEKEWKQSNDVDKLPSIDTLRQIQPIVKK